MSGEEHLELFKTASSQWLCDPYSVEIRYIAQKDNDSNKLLACSVGFWPIGSSPSSSLRVTANQIIAGREIITDCSLNELKGLVNNLEQGKLIFNDLLFSLEATQGLSYHTEMISNDRWFCDAHLLVTGDNQQPISSVDVAKINNTLRLGELPFDGIGDLISYLNLPDTISNYKQTQIEIRISPPIDIRTDESILSKGKFNLILNAHPKFDTKSVSLAIREFPEGPLSRKQYASELKWKTNKVGRQVGKLEIRSKNSIAVQVLLMAGPNTVRRQFFDDPEKVLNRRLFTVSAFDKDLNKLKSALTESNSSHFEKAVNSLAYMLGFSGCLLNETNAPDIVLSTPQGSLVIVECTTRIADFASKLGKLVDRKNALVSMLKNAGDSTKVFCYLVCGLPKSQIVQDEVELAKHKVVLLTKESIDTLLDKLKFPVDLEELLLSDEMKLENLRIQQLDHLSNLFNSN